MHTLIMQHIHSKRHYFFFTGKRDAALAEDSV